MTWIRDGKVSILDALANVNIDVNFNQDVNFEDVDINGTLNVNSATTLGSTLAVTGVTNFGGIVNVDANMVITGYISTVNEMTYYGSAYGFVHDTGLWEDLRFPAAGILKKGPYDPPGDDVDTGSLLFSDSVREAGVITAQMPHGWKSGTNIEPHLHIIPDWGTDPGAGPANKSRWTLEYIIADVGDTIPDVNTAGSWTTANADANVTAFSGGLPVHQLVDFPEIDMSAYQDSCMMYMRVSRRGDDGTNDTYPADITLIEFDIHYRHNTFGSINEHGEDF